MDQYFPCVKAELRFHIHKNGKCLDQLIDDSRRRVIQPLGYAEIVKKTMFQTEFLYTTLY